MKARKIVQICLSKTAPPIAGQRAVIEAQAAAARTFLALMAAKNEKAAPSSPKQQRRRDHGA